MSLRFVIPFGMVAFGCLPFEGAVGDLHAAGATMSGASAVKVAATGTPAAARATASGTSTVKVGVTGSPQASTATLTGAAHARLVASGALQAGTATIGGFTKKPFQDAATASKGQIHLVEMEALQRSLTRDSIAWVAPFGMTPFGMAPEDDADSAIVTFGFSDAGYVSPTTGTKPNTIFLGRVSQPLRMARSIAIAPESERRVNMEFGQISLVNSDGELDSAALEYAVDGRPVQVKLGLASFEYGDFKPVFTGRSTGWTPGFDSMDLTVRDQTYLLDVELHPETYGGAGGYDGTDQLAGKVRPDCFGKCLNVSPVLVDPANLVFQFHRRQAQAVDAVYDRRVALVFGADHATYADLVGATIAGGHFDTCLAKGLIRPGSSPTLLTADVRGDSAGTYVDTTAAIAQRLITVYGSFSSGDLDADLWSAFDAAAPGTVGWYSAEPVQISAALSQIIGGCSGHWGADFDGLIGAFVLDEPDPANVIFQYDQANIRQINRVAAPSNTYPPRWRQRMGYQKNWTVMSGENVAGSVSDADRAFAGEEYRLVTSSDDQTRTEFLTALDPGQVGTYFDDDADAQDVSDRNLRLFGSPRDTLQLVVGLAAYMTPVGSTANIVHPRVNGGAGKLVRVIDAEIDAAAQQVTLVVWG